MQDKINYILKSYEEKTGINYNTYDIKKDAWFAKEELINILTLKQLELFDKYCVLYQKYIKTEQKELIEHTIKIINEKKW